MQGSIAVLLPLLSREREHHEDMQKAGVAHRLSQSMDELLRETVRALAKLSALRQNQRPLVESEQVAGRHCLHLLHLLHLHHHHHRGYLIGVLLSPLSCQDSRRRPLVRSPGP